MSPEECKAFATEMKWDPSSKSLHLRSGNPLKCPIRRSGVAGSGR